jgi:hypothetical protein
MKKYLAYILIFAWGIYFGSALMAQASRSQTVPIDSSGNFEMATKVSVGTTTAPGLATVFVNGQIKYNNDVDATSTTSTTTIDFSQGARQMITLGSATTTVYLTNTENMDSDALKVCQDGTGSRTVTWVASSTNTSSTVDWGAAGTPTLSTGVYKCDWFTFLTSPQNRNTAQSIVQGFYGQNGYAQ